ncbi:MAG: hypothetical protein LBJ08_04955, partial [Bifidobacteriaceae bacterium]|nr:hypothetical protein [Bifidobacteriaceae bacterium]
MAKGVARRAAVLGHPIAHSLSPVLHRAAYAALGLDRWQYGIVDVDAGDLEAFVAAAAVDDAGPPWAGFSLTMPLKVQALALAAAVDPVARLVGGANTLTPAVGGGWMAANT